VPTVLKNAPSVKTADGAELMIDPDFGQMAIPKFVA
jgi:hypothetical protein